MQQLALWLDWQFWQVIVAAAAALLGFFGGTVFTHSLDRRRDREKERAAALSLAVALHAEISAIRAKAGQLFGLIGQLLGWLLQAANSAPQSLMALDLFLAR